MPIRAQQPPQTANTAPAATPKPAHATYKRSKRKAPRQRCAAPPCANPAPTKPHPAAPACSTYSALFRQVLFVLERVPDILDVIVILESIQQLAHQLELIGVGQTGGGHGDHGPDRRRRDLSVATSPPLLPMKMKY